MDSLEGGLDSANSVVSRAGEGWTPVPSGEYVPDGSPLAPLNGHVFFSASGYMIDAPQDQLNRVPTDKLATLRSYVAKTNADIAAGALKIIANGVGSLSHVASPAPSTEFAPNWSGSHGYVELHWYGWKIYVDSYLANKIIGGTWTAAGISAMMGVDAPVAAAIGASAGIMQLCQNSKGAITFYYVGVFPTGGFVCNPFS